MGTGIPGSADAGAVHPLTPTYGWLHPDPSRAVDLAVVTTLLAGWGVVAAVRSGEDVVGQSREVVALTTPDGYVARMLPGGPLERGPSVFDLAASLVEATGLAVGLGDVSVAPEDEPGLGLDELLNADEPSDEPTDVLLTRADPDTLPLLARRIGCAVDVATVDGWTLVRPVARSAQMHRHRFSDADVPAVVLTVIGGTRYVAVLPTAGYLPGHTLTRLAPWRSPLAASDVAHLPDSDRAATESILAWFADPQVEPDNALELLRADGFDLDAATVGAALQSDADEQWSVRVLSALGLPTLAADVHEGRAELPDAVRVAPGGLRTALAGVLRRDGRGGRPATYRR